MRRSQYSPLLARSLVCRTILPLPTIYQSIIHGSRGSLCRPLGSHLDRILSAGKRMDDSWSLPFSIHPSIHQSLSINQSIHPSTPIDPAYRKEDLSSLVPWVGLLALTGPSGLAWMLNGMESTGLSRPAPVLQQLFPFSPSFVPHNVESQPVTALLSSLLGSIDRGSAMKVASQKTCSRKTQWVEG